MSKKNDSVEGGTKKGKGLMVKAVLGLALIAAGGGAAFGMMQAGLFGEHEEEDNSPKLIRKGEEDPYAPRPRRRKAKALAKSMAKAAANIARPISASARISPRTSRIPTPWCRFRSPPRPSATAGSSCG
jgi:hypothetical protein